MNNIKILKSGKAIIDTVMSNDDLSQIIDTSDEWIYSRTGIKERKIAKDLSTLDLAYNASLEMLKDFDKTRIKYVIVATITPDRLTPSMACLLQAKLGLNGQEIMAFDLNAACSGFVYALKVASSLLSDNECALVVGVDKLSKIIDYKDRNTCVLFGDGAAGVIIEKNSDYSPLYSYAKSIGDDQDILYCKINDSNVGYLNMDGKAVFRFATEALDNGIKQVLKQANLTIDDIDLIIPHQANSRIIDYVAKKLKQPLDKFYTNLEYYGNTSAASVPLAYHQAKIENRIKPGMNIIMVGFGAGFTYGSILIKE